MWLLQTEKHDVFVVDCSLSLVYLHYQQQPEIKENILHKDIIFFKGKQQPI